MKSKFKIIITNVFIVMSISCNSQHFIYKVNEAKNLEKNEAFFIGKPLSFLLECIKPTIKTAIGIAGNNERPGYFLFYFADSKEFDSIKQKNKKPLTIKVYIKEHFDWNKKESGDNFLNWTKEDELKLGNLIIGAIRVN